MNTLIIKVWTGEFTIFANLKTREAGGFTVRNTLTKTITANTFYEVIA